ncbi:cytidine deaminase-like protein [Fimicolochytrium jonesii]|uniref:cytidine deaminase-like protein n=1 Tax=Fimicolochytrium jonesii TaxID=1396493 RepID=UPI0022FF0E84|nr:cytidine deaminase-like protein [Fimicolochytrium jonesii]KAI8827081.1 cytidine deaminase-like protein [Fimicolochytrium jonesii]
MSPENSTTANDPTDADFMQLAILEAQKSIPVPSAYCVGAVLVSPSGSRAAHPTILSTGFSRELPGNTHAEQCCLLKLSETNSIEKAKGATIYTTMEPCGERLSGNLPCARRLLEVGIGRVVVGVGEPKNFIAECQGTRQLRESGVVVDYLVGFEEACLAPNKHIVSA